MQLSKRDVFAALIGALVTAGAGFGFVAVTNVVAVGEIAQVFAGPGEFVRPADDGLELEVGSSFFKRTEVDGAMRTLVLFDEGALGIDLEPLTNPELWVVLAANVLPAVYVHDGVERPIESSRWIYNNPNGVVRVVFEDGGEAFLLPSVFDRVELR
jgi:hypothetical protein